MSYVNQPAGGAKARLLDLLEDSLALEQHVGLSEQGNFRSQAPLAVGQVADVTSQLLLALPARLQLALQPPQLLLQPEKLRGKERRLLALTSLIFLSVFSELNGAVLGHLFSVVVLSCCGILVRHVPVGADGFGAGSLFLFSPPCRW